MQHGPNLATLREDFAAIADLEPSDRRLVQLQQSCDKILPVYVAGYKLYNHDPFTPEERAQMAKDAFLGGLLGDDERQQDVLAKALAGALEVAISRGAGKKILIRASGLHAGAWTDLMPICEVLAGKKSDDSVLEFAIRSTPANRGLAFQITNCGDTDLHTVTLRVDTGLSFEMIGDAAKHYIFIPTWQKGKTIELPPGLIGSLFGMQRPTPLKACMRFAVYSDELTQDRSLDLFIEKPVVQNNGQIVIHPFSRAKGS